MADVLHLARITLEAQSPISSASGETGLFDMALARDASGLPQINGASLQGVLRHLHDEVHGPEATSKLFGFAEGKEGAAGRLFFGFGKVHNSKNGAVTGLMTDAPDFADKLLRMLAAEAPLERDHVALGHAHVTLGRGKFERVAVPRGTRFSFEIAMWGDADNQADDKDALVRVLSLIKHPAFRIGGAALRGYGRVKPICPGYRVLGLDDPEKIRCERNKPPSDQEGFKPIKLDLSKTTRAVTFHLKLKPVGLWRMGSTGQPVRTGQDELHRPDGLIHDKRGGPDKRPKDVDAAPVREPWIDWTNGAGTWKEADNGAPITVAGAAIKGPLAHRTLYHWNRLNGRMIDADSPSSEKDLEEWRVRAEELVALFGTPKEKKVEGAKGADERGQAARLIVDDAVVEVHDILALDHNSIDRFSGGVRSRILFSEEAAYSGCIETTITILKPLDGAWKDKVREAFCCALRDLLEGRLALGAKSLGYCTGGEPTFGGDSKELASWKSVYSKVVNETARVATEGEQK